MQLVGQAVEEVCSNVLANIGRGTPRVKRALLTPKEKLSEEYQDRLAKLWETMKPWPHLKVVWQVKDKVHDLYRSRNRASAEKKFALILAYLEGVDSMPLVVLRGTLTRWQDQILNHFDHGTSDGFTEGAHTKIKMMLGFHSVSELLGTTIN